MPKSLPQAEEALRLAEIGYREGKFELDRSAHRPATRATAFAGR